MVNRTALLYGISAMACSMLHTIFVSFYIDFFVRNNMSGKSSPSSLPSSNKKGDDNLNRFIIGQVVYGIWNASNDMVFGWLGDTLYNDDTESCSATPSSPVSNSKVINIENGVSWTYCRDRYYRCLHMPLGIIKYSLRPLRKYFSDPLRTAMNRRRLGRIAIGGPLWALAFAFLWLPTPWLYNWSPAAELSIKMIIYDGCFSFTTVSFRALLVDIASSSKDRERCNMYAAIFHVVGSFGVFFASLLFESAYTNAGNGNAHVNSVDVLSSRATSSDPIGVIDGGADADLTYFRIFCYSWAVLAGICFVLSSRAKGHKEVTLKRSGVCNQDQKMNFLYFLRETIKRPSMVAALIVWFVQDYSCTFATNFFGIFLAFVAAPYISPLGRSFVLLASFIVPHFITVAITPFLQTLGKKKIVSWMFGLRAIVGVGFGMMCMYFLSIVDEFRYHKDNSNNNPHKEDASGFSYIHNDEGSISVVSRNSALLFTLLLFLNRILTEGVCRLQSLILSDICDEDTVTFHRKLSMSGAIHGLVALVSKPSQSLAPVLSCIYLAHKGVLLPGDLKVGGDKDTATRIDNMTVSFNLVYTLCWLLFLTIILTTLSMLFVWKYLYKLEGSYLIEIRAVIRSREILNDVEEGNDHSNSALARRKNDGASEDFLISQFQGTPGDGVHLHQRRSNSKSVYSLNSK